VVISAALLNVRHANTDETLSTYERTMLLVSHQRRLLPRESISGVVHNRDMLLLARHSRDSKGERRSLAGVSYLMRRYRRLCQHWSHTGTGEILLTCMSMISVSQMDRAFTCGTISGFVYVRDLLMDEIHARIREIRKKTADLPVN
jgi:hypothetical protein